MGATPSSKNAQKRKFYPNIRVVGHMYIHILITWTHSRPCCCSCAAHSKLEHEKERREREREKKREQTEPGVKQCVRVWGPKGGNREPNRAPPPNRGPRGPCDPTQHLSQKHPRTMALPWGSLARGAGTMTRGVCHVQWRVRPSSVWKSCKHNRQWNKNKTNEEGTKRPADKRPKKRLRASPRKPKIPRGQETHPKNARRTHVRPKQAGNDSGKGDKK